MILRNWKHFDFLLLAAMLLLIIFSIAMIDSAIAGNIELLENNTLRRQIVFALGGFVLLMGLTAVDYHIWPTLGRVLYLICFLFLGFIILSGQISFGAQRWIDLGVAVVQPSELAKISMILILADYFARNRDRVHDWGMIIGSGLWLFGLMGLVFIQPDLSTSLTLMVIWGAMFFAVGMTWQQIAVFGVAGLSAPILSYPFLQGYQQQRIINFLFPDPDARFGEIYNITQAKISIGSGGWLGQGYGQGTQVQLRFLKVRHTDFIFSAISEEFGFVGALLIMLILLFIVYRILRAGRLAHDPYGALICYGSAALLFFQTTVNIGMNLNLMPVTGLPLPFVSQGGSSLVAMMMLIGLVQSVVARHKRLEF
jgi:rod shape determining protein RodA